MQETWGSTPGLGRSPGEGSGNPLQYSCLENPMEEGDWRAIVHGVAKELDNTQRLNNNKNKCKINNRLKRQYKKKHVQYLIHNFIYDDYLLE